MEKKFSLLLTVDGYAVNDLDVSMEVNISKRFVGTHKTSKIGQYAIGAYRVLASAVDFA
jgi:hypothetical protein